MSVVIGPFDPTTPIGKTMALAKIDAMVKQGELTEEEAEKLKTQTKQVSGDISTNQLIMALVLLKVAKMPGGLQVIRDLGKEFLKGMFNTLHALGQASSANAVTAWANPYLVMSMLHRFGFVSDHSLVQFRVGLSIISGAGIAEGFVDTIHAIWPFSKPEPSPYPDSIVFSSPATTEELRDIEAELKK